MEGEKPAIRDNIPRDKQTWKVWSESSDVKMTSFRQEDCWLKKVLDKNPNANVKKGLEDLKNNTSNFPNKESIDLRKSDDYIKKRKEIVGNIGYENSKLQNDKIFDFKLNEQLKNSTTASKEFIQDNIKSANNDWLRSTNEMSLVKQAFRDSYDLQKESKLLNKDILKVKS